MVSGLSIVFMLTTLVIAFFIPILLAVVLYKRLKMSVPAIMTGALIFFVSQILIRINLLKLLSGMEWYKGVASNALLLGLFLGITAGLFEETGRFIGFRFMLKKGLQWKNGIAYGVGHGGIESIMLVGFTYINNIIFSLLINTGGFDKIIAPQLPAETAEQIRNALVSTSPSAFALAGAERAMTLVIQIALSLLVLYGVMNRRVIFVVFAVLLHTLLDAPLVLLNRYGIWVLEGYVFVWCIISLIFIIRSKAFFNERLNVSASGATDVKAG